MHFLNGNKLEGAVRGSAQPKLTQKDLNNLRVPLPSYAEQERIAAVIEEQFSRLDAGISMLQRAQRNLKPARMSVLDAAAMGKFIGIQHDRWGEAALGDVLDDIHAGRSFKCEERPAGLDEWGVVKVSAMTWGQFRETENKTVIDHRMADPRFEISPGDLLVSRANTIEYVGAAVLVGKCRPRLLLSDKSLRLVPNSRVLPEWLLISLRTSRARRYIESIATGTSDSMRNISQPKLKELRIPLPPIDVQSQFAAEADRMLSQIEQLDQSLTGARRSVQALRSSILSAAFSGKLI
jgi:type I restriction enzyme S subunit